MKNQFSHVGKRLSIDLLFGIHNGRMTLRISIFRK